MSGVILGVDLGLFEGDGLLVGVVCMDICFISGKVFYKLLY